MSERPVIIYAPRVYVHYIGPNYYTDVYAILLLKHLRMVRRVAVVVVANFIHNGIFQCRHTYNVIYSKCSRSVDRKYSCHS